MVGSINAPISGPNTFTNFQAAAEKLGTNQPKDTNVGGLVGLGASATASAGPIPTSGSGSNGAGHLTVGGMSLLVSLGIAIGLL